MNVELDTGYEERSARIEMIPLMDVIFLLLVFFIYSMFTMVVQRGVRVDLPEAEGESQPQELLTITITTDGKYLLDKEEMGRDDVVLAAVERHRITSLPLLINADREVPLGLGVELLAQLRQGGIEVVTFQVKPEGAP